MRKADGLPLFYRLPLCYTAVYSNEKEVGGWSSCWTGWAANPQVWAWFTTAVRFLFPVLALLILIRTIRSLLTVPCLPEVWAYLTLPNGAQEPLTHWENILGRGGNSDVILNYPVVSRQHAALIRQADDTRTA